MMDNYLLDKSFLKEIDKQINKEVYTRILSLDKKNRVQEEITGKVISGSISIDGKSAVRRTCSLNLFSQEIDLNNYYWGLNTKFKVEIGLKNEINSNYPDILWFPQGVYFITSFSTSISNGDYSISIQGTDKMASLNGDLGGIFFSDIDLDYMEEVVNNTVTNKKKIPIYEIIKDLLTLYGQEEYQNVIIEDLPAFGFELLEYKGDVPIYLIMENINEVKKVANITLDKDMKCYYWSDAKKEEIETTLSNIPYYDVLNELSDNEPIKIAFVSSSSSKNYPYSIVKGTYGTSLGYHLTDLVFPGELTLKTGDTITTALDKIVNVLGDYEYFYNTEGQFIFRKKKHYIKTSFQPFAQDDKGNITFEGFTPYSYNFDNTSTITSISNSPNLLNIKNDFSIWGEREGINGAKLPIHLRYAIDKKPKYYKPIKLTQADMDLIIKFYPEEYKKPAEERFWYKQYYQRYDNSVKWVSYKHRDWREVLYRMALDYNRYAAVLPEFHLRVAEANPSYPTGITGYEIYYTDIISFWRDLYNPSPDEDKEDLYYSKNAKGNYKCWRKDVFTSPETLNFWIDFLDAPGSELEKYSVQAIGQRPKAINDNTIKTIYYRETPNILFYSNSSAEDVENIEDFYNTGNYSLFHLTEELMDMFSISGKGTDSFQKLQSELNTHTNAAETISLSTLPIYYLEPNTTISAVDKNTNISGDYIINSISYSLGAEPTMSLQCDKVQQTIE